MGFYNDDAENLLKVAHESSEGKIRSGGNVGSQYFATLMVTTPDQETKL